MTTDDSVPATLSVRQAAFIGVGAMVGAGIFALLGAAGEVAGAAVWVSFLFAGAVAALQGYSFAKFGARYPSVPVFWSTSSAPSETGTSRESSAGCCWRPTRSSPRWSRSRSAATPSAAFADGDGGWTKAFAVLVVVVMTILNVLGSQVVAKAQTLVVIVVIGILTIFAVTTLANLDPDLFAFSGLPVRSATSCPASR